MKFENTEVWGFKHAVRDMRNPMESWNKSDSKHCYSIPCSECVHYADNRKCLQAVDDTTRNPFVIGKNDLALAQRLIKAGSEHRKFMRQIFVSVDITAPLYWWKEFDTYKVGTVSDSCSTMHKLADTPITIDCFEMDDFENCKFDMSVKNFWESYLIPTLEQLRIKYNDTKAKEFWKELIRLLPESWLQKRTVTMSYENVLNMYRQRRNHRLTEWSVVFIQWAESLPYARELFVEPFANKAE